MATADRKEREKKQRRNTLPGARMLYERLIGCVESDAVGRDKSRKVGECMFEFAQQNQDYY